LDKILRYSGPGHGERLPGHRAAARRGSQDGAGQTGMRLGPAWAGEGAAGDERSGCQPRRPGPAALAVAREFRPAPAGGGLAAGRRRMRPRPGRPGRGAGAGIQAGPLPRGRGARGSCPAWNPIAAVCRPPVPATPAPATLSLGRRQAASRPRSRRRMTSASSPGRQPGTSVAPLSSSRRPARAPPEAPAWPAAC